MQTIDNPNSIAYSRPLWTETQLRSFVISAELPWIKLLYRTNYTKSGLATSGRVTVHGMTAYDIIVTESIPRLAVAWVVVGKPL